MILVKITNLNNVDSCDMCKGLIKKYGIRRVYNYSIAK
jgi:tRNA(Arg) A34 adenosine deaminase TadA